MHEKPRPPGLGRETLVLAAYEYRPALQVVIRQTAAACGRKLQAADVDDLLQETYLALWQAGHVAEPAATTGYAGRTARHVTIDAVRSSVAWKRGSGQLASFADGDAIVSQEPSPERRCIARDALADRLGTIRLCLGARAFAPFYLTCVLGLTSRETAKRLGSSPIAVDSALHRARRRLADDGLILRRRRR